MNTKVLDLAPETSKEMRIKKRLVSINQ